ncbi:ParB/RepB/Spo0J family partition protein [Nodosilinea sp. LEGE 06152]|uniref:ParB/RepB/Spo0J family partition protein n=1 Tax=Nodosilinea sp. LEGE 06152 TaxID=2777966 RepID=UPI0018830F51|nr:ParB/RepB/Spo0J family partition protein [Nodosilinea sp. LEGE 06152]MBE9155978.1 ParB/RepB/Spo0J family partition protein [Nodosilinea sp. LEGE 06152]
MKNKKKADTGSFSLAGRGILSSFVSGSLAHAAPPGAQEQDEAQPLQATKPGATTNDDRDTRWLPVDAIRPGVFQPRQFFSEEGITNLATSFTEQGFRGAINVRPLGNGSWELIAGERRWRAAKLAGLTEVRCIVDEYTDEEALEFALIENLQREDLSKLEETEGILKLIEVKLKIPKERVLAIIRTEGHSDKRGLRSDVAPSDELGRIEAVLSSFGVELQTFRTKNLRTLTLPDDLKKAHLERGLSYSVALELLKVKDASNRKLLLEKALKGKLSFREIRDRVKAAMVDSDESSSLAGVGENSLVKRLAGIAKRLKTGINLPERSLKRKQLERLLGEIETLLGESGAT